MTGRIKKGTGYLTYGTSHLPPFLLLALLISSIPSVKAQTEKDAYYAEPLYFFQQALPQAQAIRIRQGEAYKAKWDDRIERLRFEELPGRADVLVAKKTPVRGKMKPAIRFQPLPGYDSMLIFENTPPAKQLVVTIALADPAFKKSKEVVPVEFEIWIGKKKIYATRVSTKGWHPQTLNLTLPYILHRSFRYTFKVRTALKRSRHFLFNAYLK